MGDYEKRTMKAKNITNEKFWKQTKDGRKPTNKHIRQTTQDIRQKTAKPHIHLHYLDCFANPRRTLTQVKKNGFMSKIYI